jgi:hypothetical protein
MGVGAEFVHATGVKSKARINNIRHVRSIVDEDSFLSKGIKAVLFS